MARTHIVCPTDFGARSDVVFAQAVYLAMKTHGELTAVHVTPPTEAAMWEVLPTVKELLVRWGVLGADSTMADFEDLGFDVRLRTIRDNAAAHGVEAAVQRLEPDLLVFGTHQRVGIERFLQGSVAERVARKAGLAALFLPDEAMPLVEAETGKLRLKRVLLPLHPDEQPQLAVTRGCQLVRALTDEAVQFTLLHVGDASTVPALELPPNPRWSWRSELRDGSGVVDAIVRSSRREGVDLIVMTTRGHDSLTDALLGSRTEQVLRQARCPVLVIPEIATA